MAIVPLQLARVSNLLRSSVASGTISRTQAQLLRVQNELTTGFRLNSPSDDPGDSAIALQLQKTLERRQAFADNITHAKNHLSRVDTSLSDLTDLLREAEQIASANVGSGVTAAARLSASAVVEALYNQALTNANTQFEGVYIFGGDRSTQAPFETVGNGVRFTGSTNTLQNQFDENTILPFMISGQEVFGAISDRVVSTTSLAPDVTSSTRLADLKGALSFGVQKGRFTITNGGSAATIDITGAETVGDVITKINAASATTSVTAALAADGNSIELTAGAGTFTVTETTGGTAAADLGILQTSAAASVNGSNLNAKVTELTPIASLRDGAGLNAAGFRITNMQQTADISLTGMTTVQDLLNKINNSGTHVLARINSDGTGIEIRNPVQGGPMTISELGGTTAAELGLRSFTAASTLSELNNGKGVQTVAGDDMQVTLRDGTNFTVDLDGAVTVADVISKINTAAGTTVASFATTGNGIVLTDPTAGAGTFAIAPMNFSTAVADLGLATPAVGGTITGTDVNGVYSAGVFTNLAKLRNALQANDQHGITEAAEGIRTDLERIIRVRGTTGARVQELETRETRITDENLATQSLLSSLADTDYTDAITRFSNLQNSLQAGLQTTGKVMNLSLLDFIG